MNYAEAINWLENIPISFDSNYKDYNLKLESIRLFLNHLGNPQNDLKFIHVGGTNGKGSTCHIISSILQEHGFTVGIFSSPHIYDFRERIKINSDYINKKFIVDFINENYKYILKNGLSFFEISFAISLCYFRLKNPEYSIIEVGLGGRLDATNIITPLISVITNIGYDHKKFLGDNLLDIAKEKAGIIKNKIPVIIGQFNKSLNKVFEKASLKANAKIYYVNKLNEDYKTDLQGSYQNKNIETALETLSNIPSFTLNKVMMIKGIKNIKKNTNLIARWQIIKNHPKVIFDIAHNIDSLELIFKELENIKSDIKIVFGTLDKIDQIKCLDIFPKHIRYYLCSPNTKRAMPLSKLCDRAYKLNLNFRSFKSVRNAYENAIISSSKNDVVVVTGSTYLFSEI